MCFEETQTPPRIQHRRATRVELKLKALANDHDMHMVVIGGLMNSTRSHEQSQWLFMTISQPNIYLTYINPIQSNPIHK